MQVALKQEIGQGLVAVERIDDKVIVTVGSGGAFPSGSAELTDEAKYKVFGFNSIKKHFDIEPSLKEGPRTQIEVGGEPADQV